MTDVYLLSNHKNHSHLMKYHLNEEYREKIKMKASESKKKNDEIRIYNHYKKLIENPEYLEECKNKGLRIRKVPEEFKEAIYNLLKVKK